MGPPAASQAPASAAWGSQVVWWPGICADRTANACSSLMRRLRCGTGTRLITRTLPAEGDDSLLAAGRCWV
jgi:hypothetical protein